MDINGQDLIRACSAIGAGLAVIQPTERRVKVVSTGIYIFV